MRKRKDDRGSDEKSLAVFSAKVQRGGRASFPSVDAAVVCHRMRKPPHQRSGGSPSTSLSAKQISKARKAAHAFCSTTHQGFR